MTLKLYDTYSNEKKLFKPIDASNVRMYVCGPTVYSFPHIGNMRPVIIFDLLYRLLIHTYGKEHVTYVRNITDIDDKIIEEANSQKITIEKLTNDNIEYFHNICKESGNLKPTVEPKATEHLKEMIEIIDELIEKNFAYVSDGNVLFSIEKFEKYGKLSGKNIEDLKSGIRVKVEEYKKNSGDFVLWKPAKENEPFYPSPWGNGRPGWHIECSAMSQKYLGNTFDIHGGGQDLIFPHHENEIAQSYCATNQPLSNYWMHNGYINVEGEKMSKSLKNTILMNDVENLYINTSKLELNLPLPYEPFRLAMFISHYRQPINWTKKLLDQTVKTIMNWYRHFYEGDEIIFDKNNISKEFLDAISDDLNTPKAVAILHDLFDGVKKGIEEDRIKFFNSAQFLGLMGASKEKWNEAQGSKDRILKLNLSAEGNLEEVNILKKERDKARENKDFKKADEIREKLKELGVNVIDEKS